MARLVRANRKAMLTQPLSTALVSRKASQKTTGLRTTAAVDHIRFCSYQPRTEILDYRGHRLSKSGQLKFG